VVTSTAGASLVVAVDTYTYINIPAITSVNPNFGPLTGGTTVVITGTGFFGIFSSSGVMFSGVNASTYTVNSSTQITAIAPAHAIGVVDIVVTSTASATPIVLADRYTYYPLPTVTNANPNFGALTGGTTVVITGTNFNGIFVSSGVRFNGVNAASYVVNSSTRITAITPAHAVGVVDIVVVSTAGASLVVAVDTYTYFALPAITSVNPNIGPLAGGTTVVITGTGFIGITGVTGVKFGAVNAASYIVNYSTQITAIAPAQAAGTVDIVATSPVGASPIVLADRYSYANSNAPMITSVSPNFGPLSGVITVVITGANFTGITVSSGVMFGGVNAASYTVNSSTQITAIPPAHAVGVVDIVATNPLGGPSPIVLAGRYTYANVPAITSISPNIGISTGGTTVVITGTGFTGITGVTSVKFDTVNATSYVVDSDTQITAVAPAHAAEVVDVVATSIAGTSPIVLGVNYRYANIPTITNVSPNFGPLSGVITVVITGTGFTGTTGAASVKFGAVNAASYTVNADTQIVAIAPAQAAGTVDIIATSPVGTSLAVLADRYTYANVPAISGITPNIGLATGGTTVVITGTGFTGITVSSGVMFGTVNATSYVVDSNTQITAITPVHVVGTVNIVVTNPSGTSPTVLADRYTYAIIPAITSVNPNFGPLAGVITVAITGSGFTGITGATSVTFGGVNAVSYIVDSDTQISAIVPAHAAGTVDIVITNLVGTSPTGVADAYTYADIPAITGLTPKIGIITGGTTVVIAGTGFTGITGVDGVKFGTVNAVSYVVNSDTQLTAITPAHAAGVVDVVTKSMAGTSPIVLVDRFIYASIPAITGISPIFGPATGGTTVVITGSGFNNIIGVAGVKFDTVNATSYVVDSDTQLTAVSPAHTAGVVDIVMTNPVGSSPIVQADKYTYFLTSVIGTYFDPYIFPSPATGSTAFIAYYMTDSGLANIRIYNEIGELIDALEERKSSGAQSSSIDVDKMAPGVYFYLLNMNYDGGTTQKHSKRKFVVIH